MLGLSPLSFPYLIGQLYRFFSTHSFVDLHTVPCCASACKFLYDGIDGNPEPRDVYKVILVYPEWETQPWWTALQRIMAKTRQKLSVYQKTLW